MSQKNVLINLKKFCIKIEKSFLKYHSGTWEGDQLEPTVCQRKYQQSSGWVRGMTYVSQLSVSSAILYSVV